MTMWFQQQREFVDAAKLALLIVGLSMFAYSVTFKLRGTRENGARVWIVGANANRSRRRERLSPGPPAASNTFTPMATLR